MRQACIWKMFLLNLVLVGCTMGPSYQQAPEMNIPLEWNSLPSEGMVEKDPNCFVWWKALNDPILNSLIQRAAQQNLDLYIAGTRILEARAERKGKEAEVYPHVDASVTGGHLCASKDALINGVLGGTLPSHSKHSVKRNINFFEIGFDADWEIDLFGLQKHETQALKAKIESAEEQLCAIWVTLSAEVARNYIELRSFQQRLQLLQLNIAFQADGVHLTEQLLMIGMASSLDLLHAKQQLSQLTTQLPFLKLSIDKAIHRLSILLSYPPGELFIELMEPQALPHVPCEKPIGIPSELLRRRPDIRRAERELAAATESVGSAVAALFPRFSLYGFVGEISTHLHSLTKGSSATWFIAPQMLLPIFNSRLLTQDVELNKIRARQALFDYQKAVLAALEEVENALVAFRYEKERQQALDETYTLHQETYQLTLQLYHRGLKDYLAVLETQRALLAAQETSMQSEADLLVHYIALYKALGGGWDVAQGAEEDSCPCQNLADVVKEHYRENKGFE